PFAAGRPPGRDGWLIGAPSLLRLVPAPPPVDGGDDEEDLSGGLPQQAVLLRCGEPDAHEDGEEQDVAHDPDRPGPDPTPQAGVGGEQPEAVADDLSPQDVVAKDRQGRAEELIP